MKQDARIFPGTLEGEYQQLLVILDVDLKCWMFVICEENDLRSRIVNRMRHDLSMPIFIWEQQEGNPYPHTYYTDQLTAEQLQQEAVGIFNGVPQLDADSVQSLDSDRESFARYPHTYVIFVKNKEEIEYMIQNAEQLWRQRRGMADFSIKIAIPNKRTRKSKRAQK